MRTVAVLFARADSIYKTLPGCDVFDIERDARTWQGGAPVVAHPPCRAWSQLRKFAKPLRGERHLATLAIRLVRRFGGVLEHPASSLLWPRCGLPAPGQRDAFGGWTLGVHQHAWGHRAAKPTLLYIVGISPRDIPEIPVRFEAPTHKVVSSAGFRKGMPGWRPEVGKREREATPPPICRVARRARAAHLGA